MSVAPPWLQEALGAVEPVELSPRGQGLEARLEFGAGRRLVVSVTPGRPERAAGWLGARCHGDLRAVDGLDPEQAAALLAHVGRCMEPRFDELRAGVGGGDEGIAYLRSVAEGADDPRAPRTSPGRVGAACRWLEAARRGDNRERDRARTTLDREHDLPADVATHLDEAAGDWAAAADRAVQGVWARLARARCLLRLQRPDDVPAAVGRIWGRGTSLETRREAARLLAAAGGGPAADHALRHNAAAGMAPDRAALAAWQGGETLAPALPIGWRVAAGELLRWVGGESQADLPAPVPLDDELLSLLKGFERTGHACLRGALGEGGVEAWIDACRAAAQADPEGAIDVEDADVDAASVLRFREGDPATWIPGRVVMRAPEGLDLPQEAPRLYALICSLVGGVERLSDATLPRRVVLQWSQRPDRDRPLADLPWHIDDPDPAMGPGGRDFGLLLLVLLRDVDAADGATLLEPGSAQRVARMLDRDAPVDTVDPAWGRRFAEGEDVVSATGRAGDVWLVHPWTLHSPGIDRSGALRLRGEDLSPVEAFGAKGLADVEPAGPAEGSAADS